MARKPEDLVGLAEVAAMLKTSRTQANRWTRREDFPEPIARLRATPVWRADDVKAWAKQRKPVPMNLSRGGRRYARSKRGHSNDPPEAAAAKPPKGVTVECPNRPKWLQSGLRCRHDRSRKPYSYAV